MSQDPTPSTTTIPPTDETSGPKFPVAEVHQACPWDRTRVLKNIQPATHVLHDLMAAQAAVASSRRAVTDVMEQHKRNLERLKKLRQTAGFKKANGSKRSVA